MKLISLILSFSIFVAVLPALPLFAQKRLKAKVRKSKNAVSQIVKNCVSEEKAEECALTFSEIEPETGDSNSKYRCSDCIVFGKVIEKAIPCYPQAAKTDKISGIIKVKVVIDETGKVVWAKAITGNEKLHKAAIAAACHTLFAPSTLIALKTKIKVSGILSYNFVPK